MTFSAPLRGTDLIDCARANASKGIETAAKRCGYTDLVRFEEEIIRAAGHLGIGIQGFQDLVDKRQPRETGVEVSPDSAAHL